MKGKNGQLALDEHSGFLYLFSVEDGLFVHIPPESLIEHLLGSKLLKAAPLGDADLNRDGFLDAADLIRLYSGRNNNPFDFFMRRIR